MLRILNQLYFFLLLVSLIILWGCKEEPSSPNNQLPTISGRPVIIDNVLDDCNAFIAAWLPGTVGQGITDLLFGDYNFTGKLSHSWSISMSQIPINYGDQNYDPLFLYAFGFTYKTNFLINVF